MKISQNPYNGQKLYEFELLSEEGFNNKLNLAVAAFEDWKTRAYRERSELMYRAARILKKEARKLAEIVTSEMGKPITQAMAEVEKCAWVCEYYAANAQSQLGDEAVGTDADLSYVRYEPLGIVLAIMPWNYPFWQVFRFAAPALMAGNVGLLKHASNVLKSAEAIEIVFRKAGFPEGCFQSLVIDTDRVGDILENPMVRAVTLTGSKPAGASVASLAGSQIKKSVLELGGNNALLVFDDADLDKTIDTCVQARFQNTGQSCIAGKRLLLQKGIAGRFTECLREAVANLKSGDPMDKETFIGVLAREDLAVELERQVSESVAMGARILTGGSRNGTYFQPTLLEGVTRQMPVFREETFGPVLGITIFGTEEEGVSLANDSDFGLGVSVFTKDKARINRIIPRFYEGAVFINDLVKSDPRLPFGGVKISGYGRELSAHGIREFTNKKTVYIRY